MFPCSRYMLNKDYGKSGKNIFSFFIFDYSRFNSYSVFFSSLKSTVRNRIRKSMRQKYEFRIKETLSDYEKKKYSKILASICNKHKSPKVPEWVLSNFFKHKNFIFFGVYQDDVLVAGSAGILIENILWLSWIGAERSHEKKCVNHFLFHKLVNFGFENEVYLNFGRSPKESGTARFKSNFLLKEEPIKITLISFLISKLAIAIFSKLQSTPFYRNIIELRLLNNTFFYIGV